MTVRAEHPEILNPVVVTDPVDVVDLNGEGFAPPFAYAAPVATIPEYTSLQQVALHGRPGARGEDFRQRPSPRAGPQLATPYGLRPGRRAKSEPLAAFPV